MANTTNWEPAYPEKINWQNLPATNTPIDEVNLGKSDNALRIIDDRVISLGKTNTYTIQPNEWYASGNPDYPYMWFKSTSDYSDDDNPSGIVTGVGNPPQKAAQTEISDNIAFAYCDHTGVYLYANFKPNYTYVFVVKGV